jgi:regulator of sigma E protease
MPVTYSVDGMPEKTATLQLSQADIDNVRNMRFTTDLTQSLHERSEPRQTNNPAIAVKWGVEETRDLILQFYLTLQRMIVDRSISHKNIMGPVGIFSAGTKFAYRGTDWLIWFLSMISANLAVVNFLPIPIVDGGLFTFLIIEKIQGRPLSPRVQSIAQVVGLALILSIFILVTIQDITR